MSYLDINDCSPNPCYPGVACRDKPAPYRGYTCGDCPAPTVGDGTTCRLPRIVSCPASLRCYPGVPCLEEGGEVACGACPAGMEGDGSLCRRKCFPPCNGHQQCSRPTCDELDVQTELIEIVTKRPQQQVVQGNTSSDPMSSVLHQNLKGPGTCRKKCR